MLPASSCVVIVLSRPSVLGDMEEIRNWWEVPSIAHFCSLFRAAFGLTDFEIEDLEDALLIDGSSEEGNNRFLADLHARLLRGLYGIKEITAENFEPYLCQVLKIRWVDELGKKNPLADREYSKLTTREKVEVLHDLCDFRLDVEDVPELLKGLDADSLRVEPLGFDAEGCTYWYFYGTRLYREEKPPEHGEKPKKKSIKKKKVEAKNKKKKGKVKKKKKSKVSSSDSEPETDSSPSSEPDSSEEDNVDNDENEDEHDSEEKEEQEKKLMPSWSVVCSTEEEWQQLAESFKKTKNRDEKLLYETLSVDFVPEIGKMIEAKDKAMRKKLLMELAPRRASDRIASKTQVKEEEEQMEENEKQREKERLAEERRREEEERQREKQQQAERRQQERARRARMREERQWLMANGEFVPEELRLSTGKEEERAEQVVENKVATDASSSLQHGPDDDDLEDRDEDLYTGMYKVMDALKKHNNAWPFLEPVEESYAPQYYEIIEQPMDLSTIEQKLDDSKYKNLNEFVADMKLMFENCLEYNGQDSMYTKMANSLEAAFNRHLKKHFPEDDDNSDEDFEEELARKSKKDKKRRSESHSTPEMFRGVQTPDEHHFAPQLAPSGMQSMFPNHMMSSTMTNGGMMPSHHPSRMPFPGPPHFAADGRPLYPPQFYQNTFNPAAFARFGMAQAAAPQYNRMRYPQGNPMSQMGQPPQPSPFPPQGIPARLPFQFGMPSGGGHSLRENDMNGPNQMEQPKQLSPQQLGPVSTSGEPTPSAVTGGMERGRQLRQPHRPPYYRPQSFNQAFPGYSRNSGMPPYGAPGTASYSQPMIPGREPWRIDRRTPEAAPQRVPLANGPFRDEGQPSNPPEPTKDRTPSYNFPGSQPKTDGSSESDERDSGPEHQQELRDTLNKEPREENPHQPRNRVPATLSISHILSGASREGQQQQQGAGARLQQTPGQVTGQVASSSPPALDKRAPHAPNNIEGAKPANNPYDAFSGKGPYEGAPGRESFGGMYGREHYRNVQNEGLEWKGPPQDGLHRKEPFENAFNMKFNDRKFPGDATESVIKKSTYENVPESSSSKKMPELRPIKDACENTQRSEEKKSEERTLDSAPENGHLESGKTGSAGHRISADMYKQVTEGARTAPYKNWPGIQGGSSPLATGSFLQELNDAGPPSAALVEKSVTNENHRLPFTSLLKGIVPSQGSPVESRGGYVNLEATSRDRMRENMMAAGSYMRAADEKFDRFNPARPGDVSPYAMYANKRPSEMMPPLQYRPNMSTLAQQRNLEGAGMSASDPQFVDLNSMQFHHAPGYPSRDSLTREQMYFLEQQRRQQMTSSMGAMMAGGQPDRMLGFSGMLRQQQLFDAAYASHMRNGEYPGYPNEEVPVKMARFS